MLKFFRRIRRKLIDEGNLKNYFFYAIGEILLVVLGILIALQINNANQQKKDRTFELRMLNEIRNDLVHDIQFFKGRLGSIKGSELASQVLINAYGTKNDSLVLQYFPYLMRGNDVTYISRQGAYEALKTTGFDKISNDSLRAGLQYLYEFDHNRQRIYLENVKKEKAQLINQLEEELLRVELIEDALGNRAFVTVVNQENVLQDARLLQLIEIIQGKNNWNRIFYRTLLSESRKVLDQLNRELDDSFPPVLIRSDAIHSVGILGSATEGGWDTDLDMLDEDQDGIYTIEIRLSKGEVKFRANDSWSINWGNYERNLSFPIGVGAQDGWNIKIKEGHYRISLDTNNGFYQFEKLE